MTGVVKNERRAEMRRGRDAEVEACLEDDLIAGLSCARFFGMGWKPRDAHATW